jgi:hypothetical protein
VITGARNFITVQPVEVARRGIMSVAEIVPATDPHSLLGAEYETDACAQGERWTEFCTQIGVTGVKTFDDVPTYITGDPFAVYAGVDCDFGGNDSRDQSNLKRAERRLSYVEGREVDEAVVALMNASDVVVGATTADLAVAFGRLEHTIALVYGGVGVITAPIATVTRAIQMGLVKRDELTDRLVTAQGTLVANVATGTATDDPAILFATGRIVLVQGPVTSHAAVGMSSAALTQTITNKALTSNVATLTSNAHGFVVGETVTVAGVDATFNGTYTITAATANTFSYAKTAANVASTGASGTASVPRQLPSRALAERIYVPLIECGIYSVAYDVP